MPRQPSCVASGFERWEGGGGEGSKNSHAPLKIGWTRRTTSIRNHKLVMISDKNHGVQLPLYYGHFEIAEFSQYQYFIDLEAD